MAPPRILRTVPSFLPHVTGPANQARHVSAGLAARGFRSTIITTNHRAPESPRRERREGVAIERSPEGPGVMAYRVVPDAARRLRSAAADVIHAHSYRNALTTHAHAAARRRGLPYVLQPHGTLSMYRHFLGPAGQLPYRLYDGATRRREVLDADAVIVATEQEREEAAAFGVAPDRLHVIPVGVAERAVPDARPGGGDPFTVLFVGRLAPDRNLEQLIRGVARLAPAQRGRMRVRIVGGGEARSRLRPGTRYPARMERLARELGLGDACAFPGPLHGADLEAAYAGADAFVYLSRYENFGQSVLEAAGHGLPVIATPTGVARDIVVAEETGFLVPLDDAAALAERLGRLMADRDATARMGRAMFERVQRRYRWERVLEQYARLYAALVE